MKWSRKMIISNNYLLLYNNHDVAKSKIQCDK